MYIPGSTPHTKCNTDTCHSCTMGRNFLLKIFSLILVVVAYLMGSVMVAAQSEYFRLFFAQDIMAHVVKESNKFYGFMIAGKVLHPYSRVLQWHDTNIEEIDSFLALVMLMGLNPRQNCKELWCTDPLLHMPILSKVMSVNRCLALVQASHFQDNTQPTGNDRMRNIRPIFDCICKSFKSSFKPFQNLVTDESLVLWRGHLHFGQYIPSKRHRFGLKIFLLCD